MILAELKDLICKLYFTNDNEQRLIKFKAYLGECEALLDKWQADENTDTKTRQSREHTIQEFLITNEKKLLDIELAYTALFEDTYDDPIDDSYEDNDYEDIESRSESDRVKRSLNDLKLRINGMKEKFTEFSL